MKKLSKRTKVFQEKVDAEKLYPLSEAINLIKDSIKSYGTLNV